MKREDVKNKITGITEEQPNWLMQENGSDITREKFLSTLSLRRATTCYCSGSLICNFYPRSPCGERRWAPTAPWRTYAISIHALLAESDLKIRVQLFGQHIFLSTLSLRRATVGLILIDCAQDISIHALLAESDELSPSAPSPLSPFLSTLSLRRATIMGNPG